MNTRSWWIWLSTYENNDAFTCKETLPLKPIFKSMSANFSNLPGDQIFQTISSWYNSKPQFFNLKIPAKKIGGCTKEKHRQPASRHHGSVSVSQKIGQPCSHIQQPHGITLRLNVSVDRFSWCWMPWVPGGRFPDRTCSARITEPWFPGTSVHKALPCRQLNIYSCLV